MLGARGHSKDSEQASSYAWLPLLPVALAGAAATTTAGTVAAYAYAGASGLMAADQALAGVRDVAKARSGSGDTQGHETLATEGIAAAIQKTTGADRETAVKYARAINLLAYLAADAAPGVNLEKGATYSPRAGRGPAPGLPHPEGGAACTTTQTLWPARTPTGCGNEPDTSPTKGEWGRLLET